MIQQMSGYVNSPLVLSTLRRENLELCLDYIRQVNAGVPICQVASREDRGVAGVIKALGFEI